VKPKKVAVALVLLCVVLLLCVLVLQSMWSWVVPDLFPRAVSEGFVAARLTFWQATKLFLFIAVVWGPAAGGRSRK